MRRQLLAGFTLFALGTGIARADDATYVVPDLCHCNTGSLSSRYSNGTMHLTAANASSGCPYLVQASSNLQSWTTIATVHGGLFGGASYDDVTSASARFYRLQNGPAPAACAAAGAPVGPVDPAVQAMHDQLNAIWKPQLDALKSYTQESDYVAHVSTLLTTPLEKTLTAQFGTTGQGPTLTQIMLAMNRSAFSAGATTHLRTLLTALGANSTNRTAATQQIKAVIASYFSNPSLLPDPDGFQRTFLLNVFMSIPSALPVLKSYTNSELINDTPGSTATLDVNGKRTYRQALFHTYLATNPNAATEALPLANEILSSSISNADKSVLLNELITRHPALLAQYLANKPAAAVLRSGGN